MKFPLVEAFLLTPEDGKEGKIGICTNTLAPGMVVNEIPFDVRKDLSVLGSLVVNRDGAERMIVNSLVHPKLEYIILFGEETLSFRPSTNLLLALMEGYDQEQKGNVILGGKGIGFQYPSVSEDLLKLFKDKVKVIPLYKHSGCKDIVLKYMEWLKPQIPEKVYSCVMNILNKKEIYYDSLVELLKIIAAYPAIEREVVELDPKEFQHLQPPIIKLEDTNEKIEVPFLVSRQADNLKVDVDFGNEAFTISGNDSYLIAYSIMDFMNKNNLKLSNEQQLLLGAEMSRIEVEIRNNLTFNSFVSSKIKNIARKEIPVASRVLMKPDKTFYYKVAIKDDSVSVQSLAHDTCMSVFELRGKTLKSIIDKLIKENRFEDYEQQFLHRFDVGIEIGRAVIALNTNNSFFQDFRNLFSVNTSNYPLLITESDSFLDNHQKIITKLYTRGITMQHPDTHKGTMRCGGVLAVYRDSSKALKNIPAIYGTGSEPAEIMREKYKDNLLKSENEAAYTYGNRTREHFGRDQLLEAAKYLKENPKSVYVIQRFDYLEDMGMVETPIYDGNGQLLRMRMETTHDPCLTHDIYFIFNNKLHGFHIARAHNIVNAYPENIFGLHDAYDQTVSKELGIELGDFFMLSSRANILLLTEEQKAKRLIAEPTKPVGQVDNSLGPYDLNFNKDSKGVAYYERKLNFVNVKPNHPCLNTLENYSGVNLIEKSADYLKKKGKGHNNPVIGCYDPRKPELNEKNRLIYFQCNNRGNKLYTTAVFVNGSKETFDSDVELCNYLSSEFSRINELELGSLFLFYVPFV